MKKFIILIFLSIFFFNFSYAEKYWSNIKGGPTTVKEAEFYIFKKFNKITPQDVPFIYPPLYGIWYSSFSGFFAIYPLSNDPDTSYKVKLVSAPRWMKDENKKDIRDHEGTTEGTIVQNGKNNYFGYNKIWWPQNDGSYKYTTGKGKIILKSKNEFIYKREKHKGIDGKVYSYFEEHFYKISPNQSYDIIKFLRKNDKSRDVSDYDILNFEEGNLQIRLNKEKEREDKSDKNKFIQIDQNGTVHIGIFTWNKNDKSKIIFDSIFCENYTLYIQNVRTIFPKKIKSYCNPLKITYSTYLYYKYRYFIYALGSILLISILFYFISKARKSELKNYNKKNKTKFKYYSDYKKHIDKIRGRELIKEEEKYELERKAAEAKSLKEEKKLKAEEKRREKIERTPSANEESSSDLGASLKRLKKMYNDGHLSKVEFEKAKNKLLK
jgi:hypothetical protein